MFRNFLEFRIFFYKFDAENKVHRFILAVNFRVTCLFGSTVQEPFSRRLPERWCDIRLSCPCSCNSLPRAPRLRHGVPWEALCRGLRWLLSRVADCSGCAGCSVSRTLAQSASSRSLEWSSNPAPTVVQRVHYTLRPPGPQFAAPLDEPLDELLDELRH